MNKEIGGYMQFELKQGFLWHEHAIPVNSGRNALRCLLQVKRPKKVFIPVFGCDSIRDAVLQEGAEIEYYYLDNKGMPECDPKMPNDWLLYINYFGLGDQQSNDIAQNFSRTILDCTQAFFFRPSKGLNIFYSPRKFFGVPDGGFFYTNEEWKVHLQRDESSDRMKHLLIRWAKGANEGYEDYRENEKKIAELPILQMSRITEAILRNVPYSEVLKVRNANFDYLYNHLNDRNQFLYNTFTQRNGPLVFPYLSRKPGLRAYLISNQVYTPNYWPEVLLRSSNDSKEFLWAQKMVYLPVDQRYGIEEMARIIELVRGFER